MTGFSLPSRVARVAFVGAGIALAAAAGANAIDNAPLAQMPAAAVALRSDSDVEMLALDQKFLVDRRYAEPTEARALARQVLRQDPLDARAIRVLAYAQDGGQRSEQGQRLARLAHKVSRREDLAEMALMEAAVLRNDAPAALSHFDIFMRVNPQGQAAVFPLLSRALTVPDIRREISRHLIGRSPWARDFVSFASSEGGQPALTADMVLAAGDKADPADLEVFGPALLTRLVEAGEFGRATRILAMMGGKRSLIEQAALTAQSTSPRYGRLAWQLASEGNRSANLTGANAQGRRGLAVYGAPGAIGSVATKILALPRGRHELSQDVSRLSGAAGETAVWALACAGGNRAPFWTSRNLVASAEGPGRESFTVPAGCPYQELSLLVRAATSGPGIDLTIEDFMIDR